jgi:hypothetical protein
VEVMVVVDEREAAHRGRSNHVRAAVSEVTGLYIDRCGMSETLLTKVLQHTQKTANQFF